MIAPSIPYNERKRQKAVESYGLLDTEEEEKYDNITSIISQICDAPIALITLLDKERNFLKSHLGVPFNESPRDISFCGHTINEDNPMMIVEDARKDDRFHDNPLVKDYNAIFYAGVSLVNKDGYKLGTLCVYDHKPRTLNTEQKNVLQSLAKQVVMLFEQRIQNDELRLLRDSLERKNKNLEKFAAVVSHDLKSPVNNIISLTDLLKKENQELSEDSLMYIEYLQQSSASLRNYIDGVLSFYKSDELFGLDKKTVKIQQLIEDCKHIVDANNQVNIHLHSTIDTIFINESAIKQVLINLLTNAIKYNEKDMVNIEVGCFEDEDFYHWSVADNGIGISKNDLAKIFDLFERLGVVDRFGNQGNGIGLATAKKIVTTLGGEIKVVSTLGKGTTFTFTVEKD
ncbi:GAF domain-containing sensor histidine kinase [uncultured Dokdonia sp.]|uniref:sensor histidine kinase n=1 Tax=uncultured Dokdonia sp. TaxID=575653 RepID=UPI002618A496|nr:GAF domain-containing sensor histidine kinase [uncultured Dokdonia sp.]